MAGTIKVAAHTLAFVGEPVLRFSKRHAVATNSAVPIQCQTKTFIDTR